MFTKEHYQAMQEKLTNGIDNSLGVDYIAHIDLDITNPDKEVSVGIGLHEDLPNTLLFDFLEDDEVYTVEKSFNGNASFKTISNLVETTIKQHIEQFYQ